jgi:hypothetical protein
MMPTLGYRFSLLAVHGLNISFGRHPRLEKIISKAPVISTTNFKGLAQKDRPY